MTKYYRLNEHLELEGKAGDNAEVLFPADPVFFDESQSQWTMFERLFPTQDGNFRWGAIGVLHQKLTDNDHDFSYLWKYWLGMSASDRRGRIEEFVELAQRRNLVLLANIAEAAFRKLPEYQRTPRCLVLHPSTVNPPGEDAFVAAEWPHPSDTAVPFFADLGIAAEGWRAYTEAIPTIVDCSKEILLYVPIICHRDGKLTLGGGLVWCLAAAGWQELVKDLPEIQLVLRWYYSELLGICRQLGLQASRSMRIREAVIRKRRENEWFNKRANNEVKHHHFEVPPIHQDRVVRKFRLELGVSQFTCKFSEIHEAVKCLCLGVLQQDRNGWQARGRSIDLCSFEVLLRLGLENPDRCRRTFQQAPVDDGGNPIHIDPASFNRDSDALATAEALWHLLETQRMPDQDVVLRHVSVHSGIEVLRFEFTSADGQSANLTALFWRFNIGDEHNVLTQLKERIHISSFPIFIVDGHFSVNPDGDSSFVGCVDGHLALVWRRLP